MSEFISFLLGALAAFGVYHWLVHRQPRTARFLGLLGETAPIPQTSATPSPNPVTGIVPAVDPARMPDALTPEEVRVGAAAYLPDEELKQIVELLPDWNPRRHQDERKFHASFEDFLLRSGYDNDDIERARRISWNVSDYSLEKRYARPDFVIRGRVLVEIKRSLSATSETDRSLGQMLRYLTAWAGRGPALLLVCNDCDDNLRAMVQYHVRSWKAQDVPVMAYFVR